MRRLFLLLLLLLPACLGGSSLPRSYYVLASEPLDFKHHAPALRGLVYVRNLDVDAVYEKFQIVVRNSPYELRYAEQNVWAVKPNEQMSDILAQALEHTNTFEAVTRELVTSRPQYTLSGQLNAAEIYDSNDLWFAHLSVTLSLARFSDGARVWSYEYDQRKQISSQTFAHGVRGLSELSKNVVTDVVKQLGKLGGVAPAEDQAAEQKSPFDEALPGGAAEEVDPTEPIFVPEEDREKK